MSDTTYTIGSLAQSANVPVSTIRFYERRGILRPDGRSPANYRRYSHGSLEKLRLIRCAQGIGLSLRDVRELMRLIDTDRSPCKDIEQVMRRRLDDIRARMRDLRRLERALVKSLGVCCGGKERGICETIIQIKRDVGAPVEFCSSCP